jgi:viologen exporter family transport system permease protein
MSQARIFWELVRRAIQRQMTYRAATLAGLATNFFFGLLRAAVLVALYGRSQQVAGMSVQDAITYTGLTQAIIAYLSLFGWYELAQSVYSGQVGADLLKPIHLFTFWMGQDLGRAVVQLVLRGLPLLAFYALAFRITTPTTVGQWLALLAALGLGWLVSYAWRFLANLAAFWSPNASGIIRLVFTLSWFLSGFLVPLRFLPQWFQTVCYLTPFPYTVNTVVEVYLGLLHGPALLQALAWQAAWAAGLILGGQALLRAGVRRLVILGG